MMALWYKRGEDTVHIMCHDILQNYGGLETHVDPRVRLIIQRFLTTPDI